MGNAPGHHRHHAVNWRLTDEHRHMPQALSIAQQRRCTAGDADQSVRMWMNRPPAPWASARMPGEQLRPADAADDHGPAFRTTLGPLHRSPRDRWPDRWQSPPSRKIGQITRPWPLLERQSQPADERSDDSRQACDQGASSPPPPPTERGNRRHVQPGRPMKARVGAWKRPHQKPHRATAAGRQLPASSLAGHALRPGDYRRQAGGSGVPDRSPHNSILACARGGRRPPHLWPPSRPSASPPEDRRARD
jgi:hypothetical protein